MNPIKSFLAVIIIACFLPESANLFSQSYQWAFKAGSTSPDVGRSMVIDGSSNIYVTGLFDGTVDFDPGGGVANLTATISGFDIFLAKYNSSGVYQWAFKIGGGNANYGLGIAVDGSANVYITGYFESTPDFDPGVGVANLTSAGNQDIFVAKYNSAGAYQWAFKVGAASDDQGVGIALDASANVYLTGSFQNTTDFDPGAGVANLSSSGGIDIFVAKYNSSGAYQWAFKVGSASAEEGRSVAVDASSNVYVVGHFQSSADFDPGAGLATLTSAGSFDIFLAKYNSSGAYQWAFKVGSTSADRGYGIAIDGAANIYVTGGFGITSDFDPSASVTNLTSAGAGDIFVAKYNSSGAYQWAFGIGGTSQDEGLGIAVDGTSNVYITSYFSGTADFDPGVGIVNLSSVGLEDIYVAKYNSSGAYQWAFSIGASSSDYGSSIVLDGNSNAYVTGSFRNSTADFDPGAGISNLTSSGVEDIFIAKYGSGLLPVELLSFTGNCSTMQNFPYRGRVELTWSTASEENNDYFTIERTTDGINFETIGKVKGAGNSNETIYYSFTDDDLLPGISYYRLKQTDFNGQSEWFRLSAVNCDATEKSISIYPNPSSDGNFTLSFSSPEKTDYKSNSYWIEIQNVFGEIIYQETFSNMPGNFTKTLNLSKFAKGIYFILLRNGNSQKTIKILVE